MAIFEIFETTQLQGWEFHLNKLFCNLSFPKFSPQLQVRNFELSKIIKLIVMEIFLKKSQKKVISGKLHNFEQSFLEEKLTVPLGDRILNS